MLTSLPEAAIEANAPLHDELENNAGPIDSDEEKDAVMAAITRSRPQPLVRNVMVPIRRKYQYVRMKEMLANAMGGIRGRGLFAVGDFSSREPASAADGDTSGMCITLNVGLSLTVSSMIYNEIKLAFEVSFLRIGRAALDVERIWTCVGCVRTWPRHLSLGPCSFVKCSGVCFWRWSYHQR